MELIKDPLSVSKLELKMKFFLTLLINCLLFLAGRRTNALKCCMLNYSVCTVEVILFGGVSISIRLFITIRWYKSKKDDIGGRAVG